MLGTSHMKRKRAADTFGFWKTCLEEPRPPVPDPDLHQDPSVRTC